MRCEQTDTMLETCWEKTGDYYDRKLLETLNDWSGLRVNIDNWKRRHDPNYKFDFLNLSSEAASSYCDNVSSRIFEFGDDHLILTQEYMTQIIHALLNLVNICNIYYICIMKKLKNGRVGVMLYFSFNIKLPIFSLKIFHKLHFCHTIV